eukprot:1178474-Prorocentrum_minimum.AAC.2
MKSGSSVRQMPSCGHQALVKSLNASGRCPPADIKPLLSHSATGKFRSPPNDFSVSGLLFVEAACPCRALCALPGETAPPSVPVSARLKRIEH